jgi:membrane protein involved in colicin uptake
LLLGRNLVVRLGEKQIPPLRYGMTTKKQATAKAKEHATAKAKEHATANAKYGGLSASAAKCAAFGRDDDFWGGLSSFV